VHRDLALGNIMLDDQWTVRIIDFALSCHYKPAARMQKLTDSVGTAPYIAPEIVDGAPYLPYPAETFALGVCLYILVHGANPFELASEEDNTY
jgi:serine/threonine protein kinase